MMMLLLLMLLLLLLLYVVVDKQVHDSKLFDHSTWVEIAVLKKVRHQNIVHLYEVIQANSGTTLWLVMELCTRVLGSSVRQSPPAPVEQIRKWFRDIINGLNYLHVNGVIHRDMKLENCLLAADGAVKLCDFGIR